MVKRTFKKLENLVHWMQNKVMRVAQDFCTTVFTSEYFSAYAVSASSCQTNCHRAVTTEPKKGKNRELSNTFIVMCVRHTKM